MMTKRFSSSPLAVVVVSVPLLAYLSLCSLCSLTGPSAEAPAPPSSATSSGAAGATHEPSGTPVGEPPPESVAEIRLDETYHDPEGFFSIRCPQGWVTHVSGSEMQFWADD